MSIDKSQVLSLDTGVLLFGLFISVFAGYLCARLFHKNNDFKKSVMLYAAISVIIVAVLLMMKLYWLYCAGYVIMGFFSLLLFSNHYFYKS
jgi:hypothetical protein